MALLDEKITKDVPRDKKLWRYMSLDKLINILSEKKLFFTPLSFYRDTDPFESLVPKVVLDKMGEFIFSISEQQKKEKDAVLEHMKSNQMMVDPKVLSNLNEQFNNLLPNMEKVCFRILETTLVNCWHMNEVESEAMWRLYSDVNKGIAIQTTVQSLVDSIDDNRLFFSKVNYVDFYSKTADVKDYIVDRMVLSPLLKREAFKHEQEVRLHFTPKREYREYISQDFECKSELIDVDVSKLISKIYISPYAKEPYISSVRAIAKLYGIPDENVIHSNLLQIDHSLKTFNFEKLRKVQA